eukprot:1177052-Prorocentrum_minimum.AAC.2
MSRSVGPASHFPARIIKVPPRYPLDTPSLPPRYPLVMMTQLGKVAPPNIDSRFSLLDRAGFGPLEPSLPPCYPLVTPSLLPRYPLVTLSLSSHDPLGCDLAARAGVLPAAHHHMGIRHHVAVQRSGDLAPRPRPARHHGQTGAHRHQEAGDCTTEAVIAPLRR